MNSTVEKHNYLPPKGLMTNIARLAFSKFIFKGLHHARCAIEILNRCAIKILNVKMLNDFLKISFKKKNNKIVVSITNCSTEENNDLSFIMPENISECL